MSHKYDVVISKLDRDILHWYIEKYRIVNVHNELLSHNALTSNLVRDFVDEVAGPLLLSSTGGDLDFTDFIPLRSCNESTLVDDFLRRLDFEKRRKLVLGETE